MVWYEMNFPMTDMEPWTLYPIRQVLTTKDQSKALEEAIEDWLKSNNWKTC